MPRWPRRFAGLIAVASHLAREFPCPPLFEGATPTLRRLLNLWILTWESYRIEAEEFIDAGNEVVVLARVRARTRRGGVEMEHAPGAVWTVEDGRIRRIEFYLEGSQALEVARGRGSERGA